MQRVLKNQAYFKPDSLAALIAAVLLSTTGIANASENPTPLMEQGIQIGEVAIDKNSQALTVDLKDINGAVVFSKTLPVTKLGRSIFSQGKFLSCFKSYAHVVTTKQGTKLC